MNTITEELVTLEIEGVTTECYVWGRYYPAEDGGRDYPSTDEDYDITSLHTMVDDVQVSISDMLNMPLVLNSVVAQLKENAK
tara:strand:- start:1067 stop:1312 length:246 start_codon:yes stop_codon:yes gene_type:complete